MEEILIQIKEAVIKLLNALDPDVDVFFEKIKSTDEGHGLKREGTYYFFEMIPHCNDTVDQYVTDMTVLADIAYHEKNESNTAYLMKAAQLDGMIRPVFSFGGRHITIPEMNIKVTDHVLHCSFAISFRQARESSEEYQKMGELEVAFKREE